MPIYKTDKKKNGIQQYLVKVSTAKKGKVRQTTRLVYGKDEAKKVEQQLLTTMQRSDVKYQTDDFIELYLQQYDLKETTKYTYTGILANYVKGQFGFIDEITPQDVAMWRQHVADLPLSNDSKRNIYRAFTGMMAFAHKIEVIRTNPCKNIKGFGYTPKALTASDYYTADEWLRYEQTARLRAERKQNYNYYVFFCIAFYTGARKGEINALKWSDLWHNRLFISRSVNQKIKGKRCVETAPKTQSSIRFISLPIPLITVLAEQKARQQIDPRWTPDRRICGDGDILSDTAIEYENIAIAKEAGLKHIRIHDFRHSHASYLANAGINIMEISQRLGHKDVKMTWNRYSHLYPEESDRATQMLNLLGEQKK